MAHVAYGFRPVHGRHAYFRYPPAALLARWQEGLDLLVESGDLPATVVCQEDGAARCITLASRGAEAFGLQPGASPAQASLQVVATLPLSWPDGLPFGTLVGLHAQAIDPSPLLQRQLAQMRRAIEADLAAIDENLRLNEEIAAHRATERALRHSEQLHKQAQRMALLGHWHHDLVSDTLTWSDEMFRLYELERPGFVPTYDAFLALLHPDDRETLDREFRQAVQERAEFVHEYRLLMPDGRVKWMHAHAVSHYAGNGVPVASIGTTQDITARKAAEQERELLARIIRHSRELVNVATLDGQMLFLNEAGGHMLGIAPADAPRHGILEVIPPALRPLVEEELLPALFTRGYWEGPLQYRNLATGELRDYHAVCFAVSDPHSGRPSHLANVSMDITERVAAERRLLHAQKLESLGLMAGSIAHDFNNLLQVILGNLELAARPGDTPAQRAQALEQARQAAVTGAGITRQLLTFAGRDNLPQVRVDLANLVDDTARLLRTVTGAAISLQVQCPTENLPIDAVASQLQQVLLNLVMNAVDAVAGRGGSVTVRCGSIDADPSLVACSPIVPASLPARFAFVDVSDDGVGMDRGTVARLFEPFFTTKPQGRGLGMAAVLGILRSHQGAICVDSAPGKGTAIRVLLPLARSAAPAMPAVAGQHGTLAGRRILVVDDESTIRAVTCALLERRGAHVEAAENGEQAMAALAARESPPDIVVLDLTMPGLDGADTFLALRARHPQVPVLVASGFDRARAFARIGDAPRVAFIGKPWRTDELVDALAGLLEAP